MVALAVAVVAGIDVAPDDVVCATSAVACIAALAGAHFTLTIARACAIRCLLA